MLLSEVTSISIHTFHNILFRHTYNEDKRGDLWNIIKVVPFGLSIHRFDSEDKPCLCSSRPSGFCKQGLFQTSHTFSFVCNRLLTSFLLSCEDAALSHPLREQYRSMITSRVRFYLSFDTTAWLRFTYSWLINAWLRLVGWLVGWRFDGDVFLMCARHLSYTDRVRRQFDLCEYFGNFS